MPLSTSTETQGARAIKQADAAAEICRPAR